MRLDMPNQAGRSLSRETRVTSENVLPLSGLHASLADPLLDTMTFFSEATARYPEAISFAPGLPYEGFFNPAAIHDYLDAYLSYLRRNGRTEEQVSSALFQYGRTKGQIQELIAETVANDEGIQVPPAAIITTVGVQEGMFLLLRALFGGPRDVLLVSSPCYIGMTGAARLLDIEVAPVPEGEASPDPDAVDVAVREVTASGRRPRAFYVVPDFANPTGASMSVAARRRLLEIAANTEMLVIEDNPYGFFARDAERRPTLKSLDSNRVVSYLGSFAKTCFPGARLGYVIADTPVASDDGRHTLLADQLAKIKSMVTVNTSSLSQAVIGGMLLRSGCRLRAANAAAISFYRANLTAVLAALDRYIPPQTRSELGISWNVPDGGFFTVLTVPFAADAEALERSARDYGVLWTPMSAFYVGSDDGRNRLRISSSYLEPRHIPDGIRRLAAFVAAEARRTHQAG